MKAVIYTRTGAGTGRNLLDRQLEQCRALAAEHGWDVVAAYSDQGSSALSMDRRPGLQATMNLVRSHGCDVLVSDAPERISRSASGSASILADADAAGVTVHAGSFSSTDASGRLVLRIMTEP
jgi:DNA invertase Pin-like site-specific DNA recombinase